MSFFLRRRLLQRRKMRRFLNPPYEKEVFHFSGVKVELEWSIKKEINNENTIKASKKGD